MNGVSSRFKIGLGRELSRNIEEQACDPFLYASRTSSNALTRLPVGEEDACQSHHAELPLALLPSEQPDVDELVLDGRPDAQMPSRSLDLPGGSPRDTPRADRGDRDVKRRKRALPRLSL